MSKINNLQLSRICVSLQCEEKERRKRALEELCKSVCNEDWTSSELLEIWQTINKSLTKGLTDDAEFCRQSSLELWKYFINYLPIDEKYIIHLITILSRRLSAQELLEPSEEVRLNSTKLLRLIIEKYKKYLSVYCDDFVAILARTVADNYPEIKRESCKCIEELAEAIPQQFYSRSTNLVKSTLSNFTHQHWKVRVASVRAIGKILLHGNGKSMEDVSTPMAERLFDQSAAVRLAVVEVAGCWLLQLRDRYSWWHKLLPLLVTGLHDEIEDIRNRADELWSKTGELYTKENENDEKLKDQMDFLIQDPIHYPANVKRPNLGCRVLVQQNLCKLVSGITRELGDWLADIRVRSAQLLCVLVLNAEANVTQHIEKLLPAIYRACNDEDSRVVENIELASLYMGYFVPASIYCHLILPTLEDNLTAGHLRFFACILRGSESEGLRFKLREIGIFLQQPHVCRSKKARYQEQLCRCCESLIKVSQKDCLEISQELFTVLFTLLATSQEEKTIILANKLLEELSKLEEFSKLDELFVNHLRPILEDLKNSCKAWTIYSAELQMFNVCLTRGILATSKNTDIVLPILKATMSNDCDAELRLKLFIILSNYLQDKNKTMREMEDKNEFVNSILKDVIFPGLVWSAGRAAEAIRTAAICCLCALLDDGATNKEEINPEEKKSIMETIVIDEILEKPETVKPQEEEEDEEKEEEEVTKKKRDENNKVELFKNNSKDFSQLFEKIIHLLASLVDDNAKKTRLYSLRAICSMIKIGKELSIFRDDHVNDIYPVALKRLDDGCDDVRIAGIEALVVIWNARSKDYDIIFSRSHIDFLYTSAIVHLDDPDETFQSLIFEGLVELAKIHPELLATKIENSIGNFRNQVGLEKLLKHCHELLRRRK